MRKFFIGLILGIIAVASILPIIAITRVSSNPDTYAPIFYEVKLEC